MNAERAAQALLDATAKCQRAGHVQLEPVIGVLARVEISYGPVPFDGRLEHHGDRYRIVITSRATPGRQRYTLAHELGHLWLTLKAPAHGLDQEDEERFCNEFAAALLMPADRVRRSASCLPPDDLRTLTRLALEYRASMAAMLIRLHRLAAWHTSLLRWQASQNWWLASMVCVPPRLRGQLATSRHTRCLLDSLTHQRETTRASLPIVANGNHRTYPAQLATTRHSATALTDLRYPG